MILTDEMAALIRTAADSLNKAAGALESVLDAVEKEEAAKEGCWHGELSGSGGRMDHHIQNHCQCPLCTEPFSWCERCSSYHHESAPHVK